MFVGAFFSARAGVPAAAPVACEAESMSHGSCTSVKEASRRGASEGRVLRHEGGGRATKSLSLSSTSVAIVVRARSAETSTSAMAIRVFVDGTAVDTKTPTRNAESFVV